jgi:DNA polymerase I-like protein with 3'-5' exonuclease and polymerase domains
MKQKLKYCGADVYTMALVKQEIDKFAKTIPGLEASIKCANDSIVPYLCETIQGIAFDDEDRQRQIKENDRLMMQYCRMINLLIGAEGLIEIRSYLKGKPKLFPGSNKQCCAYFHTILEYPVIFKSPQTGDPSLGKKIMYRLAMKHPDNPVIPLVLAYRKVAKETSALNFIPWRGEDGKITKPIVEQEELF